MYGILQRLLLLMLSLPVCRHVSPLLRLVRVLGLEPSVYIPPLLSSLQHSSLRSLQWHVSAHGLLSTSRNSLTFPLVLV